MFFLFGWGKQTRKELSEKEFDICSYCNIDRLKVFRITTWATLFFIPVIPYETKYYLSCPNCERGYEIEEEEADKLIGKEEERYY